MKLQTDILKESWNICHSHLLAALIPKACCNLSTFHKTKHKKNSVHCSITIRYMFKTPSLNTAFIASTLTAL